MPFYWEARRLRDEQRRRLGYRPRIRPIGQCCFLQGIPGTAGAANRQVDQAGGVTEIVMDPIEALDEIERLRSAVEAIKQATIEGRVCDDVAWFDTITTLHDFCEQTLLPRMS